MNKEELTKVLEYTEKKHRHDIVNTFDTDISMMCIDVLRVLKNCIEIPSNATNGDVIKAVFPNTNIEYWAEYSTYNVEFPNDNDVKYFSYDWWNAPYKKESEEK